MSSNTSKYVLRFLFLLLGISILYFLSFIHDKSIQTQPNSIPFNLALNIAPDSSLPTLCIVTRIYGAQLTYFPILALSLYHNGPHNIRIYVVNTDIRTNLEQLNETIDFINQLVRRNDFVSLLNFGPPTRKDDFGYDMTDHALSYLYEQNLQSPSICQYVVFTNGDNFYTKNFASKLIPHMKQGKDMIGWGFVSHHGKPHYQEKIDPHRKAMPEIVDDATGKCTPIELRAGFADLGSVAYRLAFIQKHNLSFRSTGGSYSFGSDGFFVTQAASRANVSVVLRQTLFVHQ